MYNLPYKDIDYCNYGMDYRKRTRLWNNILIGFLNHYVIKIVIVWMGINIKLQLNECHMEKKEWNNQFLWYKEYLEKFTNYFKPIIMKL